MSDLTREQHIFIWKTQGGNYTWRKWAAMHGIPAHNPGFLEAAKQAASNGRAHCRELTFKQKRRKRNK